MDKKFKDILRECIPNILNRTSIIFGVKIEKILDVVVSNDIDKLQHMTLVEFENQLK